jgi:hypothetical protein
MSAREVTVQLLGGFRVAVDGRPVPEGEWRRRCSTSSLPDRAGADP